MTQFLSGLPDLIPISSANIADTAIDFHFMLKQENDTFHILTVDSSLKTTIPDYRNYPGDIAVQVAPGHGNSRHTSQRESIHYP